jgi:hypothetical protein
MSVVLACLAAVQLRTSSDGVMAGVDEHDASGHAASPAAAQTRGDRAEFPNIHQDVSGQALRGLIKARLMAR